MSDTDGRVKRSAHPKELGHDPRRLRRRRLAAGFSLTEAATAAGCTKSNLSKLEHGVHGASPELLASFADLYRCEMPDLMLPRHAALMARFAEEADPGHSLGTAERNIRAMNLLMEYLRHGEPETNGKAA